MASEFWDSNLAAALIGAGSATVTFLAGEIWRTYSGLKARTQSAISLLSLAAIELEIQQSILTALSEELDTMADTSDAYLQACLNHDKRHIPPRLPSRVINLNLLEKLRSDLAASSEDGDLLRQVCRLYFDISELQARLIRLNQKWGTDQPLDPREAINVRNFALHIRVTVGSFDACLAAIAIRIAAHRRVIFWMNANVAELAR